jgi:hypothetical protein
LFSRILFFSFVCYYQWCGSKPSWYRSGLGFSLWYSSGSASYCMKSQSWFISCTSVGDAGVVFSYRQRSYM